MGKRGRKAKNKFDDLDEDFKSAIESMNTNEIKDRIAKTALDQEALLKAKAEDQDLLEKKAAVKDASEVYREGSKMCRLRIQYAKQVLDARGVDMDSPVLKAV